MKKCRALLASACAMALGSAAYAQIGLFDNSTDIGNPPSDPALAGFAAYDPDADAYYVNGGGSDWWSDGECAHYLYKAITGDFRIEADVQVLPPDPDNPEDFGPINDWAKFGVAFRNDITGLKQVNALMAVLKPTRHAATLQARPDAAGGMNDSTWWGISPQRVALQRVKTPLGYLVNGFQDSGSGWQLVGTRLLSNLAEDAYVGLAVTSHDNGRTETAVFTNVQFKTEGLKIEGITTVPASAKVAEISDLRDPGFKIQCGKNVDGYAEAEMVWFGGPKLREYGERIDPVVNLHDTGGRGNFGDDYSFPGIDPFQQPTADPAAGDDDNDFTALVTCYIALTKGLHRLTTNSDDGAITRIGGVEVGRATEWTGVYNYDFVFNVEEDGVYEFVCYWMEGGGGAALEICDYDGASRVLLGTGSIKVGQAIPEPTTLSLLALGGLGLLARRRR